MPMEEIVCLARIWSFLLTLTIVLYMYNTSFTVYKVYKVIDTGGLVTVSISSFHVISRTLNQLFILLVLLYRFDCYMMSNHFKAFLHDCRLDKGIKRDVKMEEWTRKKRIYNGIGFLREVEKVAIISSLLHCPLQELQLLRSFSTCTRPSDIGAWTLFFRSYINKRQACHV